LGISNEAYTPESGVQSYGSHETSGHKCLGITELQAKCRPSGGRAYEETWLRQVLSASVKLAFSRWS